MKALIITTLILAGFGTATAQHDDYHVVSSTDYTKVDCNAIATRQAMLREYNARYATGQQAKAIDVLEQKKKSATQTSIECYGAYSFSDGSTKKILYKEMVNSLGKTVWIFTPDSW